MTALISCIGSNDAGGLLTFLWHKKKKNSYARLVESLCHSPRLRKLRERQMRSGDLALWPLPWDIQRVGRAQPNVLASRQTRIRHVVRHNCRGKPPAGVVIKQHARKMRENEYGRMNPLEWQGMVRVNGFRV